MNRGLIAQKIKQIAVCCRELKAIFNVSFEEFSSQAAHYRLAERDIQLVVDSAIDINNHMIIDAGRTPPATCYQTFLELGRLKVIPLGLAKRLARTTGLRNRIVHEYEGIDLTIVHRSLRPLVRDYTEYMRRIRVYAGI